MKAVELVKINYCSPSLSATGRPPVHPGASPHRVTPLHSTVQPPCRPRRLRRPVKSAASMEMSPPPGGASAIAVAGGEAKRARKRSRYLSPPYTDTEVKVDDNGEEPPPDVYAADVLSALRAAALLNLDPDAGQTLRFLTLYRRKTLANPLLHAPAAGVGHKPLLNLPTGPAPAAGVGHKPLLNLPTGPAPAMPILAPASKKKKKQNPQQPPAIRKENAAALDEAGHKRASQSSEAGNENNYAPPKRRRKNKKMMNSTGQEHFGNPVALVLDFAQGTPLPSRDDLLSTFCKFGFVIHSETAIVKDQRSARVVFATRAEAEAAYSCAETLGMFGSPFAAPRLQDLPPITLNASPPVPKLPLKDVRNNLEKMILSLTRRSASFKAGLPEEAKPVMGNLVGEMQGLLTKVDQLLQGDASSTVRHH